MTQNDKFYLPLVIALGDGWMQYGKIGKERTPFSKKADLCCVHHYRHEDYLVFKKTLLEKIGYNVTLGNKNSKGKLKGKYIRIGTCKILGSVKKQLYNSENRKIFKKEWCYKLDELALAILWMDDGCLCRSKNKRKTGDIYIYHYGEISTHSLDEESNKNFCYWLQHRFGIESYIAKKKNKQGDTQYYIKMNRDNVKILIDKVKPYVKQIPSMIYKITMVGN